MTDGLFLSIFRKASQFTSLFLDLGQLMRDFSRCTHSLLSTSRLGFLRHCLLHKFLELRSEHAFDLA